MELLILSVLAIIVISMSMYITMDSIANKLGTSLIVQGLAIMTGAAILLVLALEKYIQTTIKLIGAP